MKETVVCEAQKKTTSKSLGHQGQKWGRAVTVVLVRLSVFNKEQWGGRAPPAPRAASSGGCPFESYKNSHQRQNKKPDMKINCTLNKKEQIKMQYAGIINPKINM